MSKTTALDNIWLNPTDRWGHTEYSLNYHPEYLAHKSGFSQDARGFDKAVQETFQLDFEFHTNNGLINWKEAGRVTDMGHATYAADGSDQRSSVPCPFASEEEVWDFDAVEEYGLPDFNEQVAAYEEIMQRARQKDADKLIPGGYYKTIVSGAIAAFGWDMFLLAAADPVKMEKVLDSFYRRTLFFMQAWAQTSAEVIIQHDDFVWTGGAFMDPTFYRKAIIPRYAELWKPLHEAGKKVLFISDGDFMEFADDVAEAGADGFIFEPYMDFGEMVRRFGQSHCLVGSYVDCRDLTFRRQEKVEQDIDRTFEALADCRGAIVAVGNHLPPNISPEMLDFYFERLLPRLTK